MRFMRLISLAIGISLTSSVASQTALAAPAPTRSLKSIISSATGKSAEPAKPQLRDKWALIVGADKFADPSLPEQPIVRQSAMEVEEAFKDATSGKFAKEHVRSLIGEQATSSDVTRAIDEWLLKKALPGDLIVIYFAGKIAVSPTNELIFTAYDTPAKDVLTRGIKLKPLLSEVKRRTQSPYVLFLLDTAPGQAASPSEGGRAALQSLRDSGVSYFTAALPGQDPVAGTVPIRTSFGQRLVEAVKFNGGSLNLSQIKEHLLRYVREDAEAKGKAQSPQFYVPAESFQIWQVSLGMPQRVVGMKQPTQFGHNLDDLPISRPELVAPHTVAAAKAAASKPIAKQPARPAAADDEDDDDGGANVDFSGYMVKMKQSIQANWKPPKGLETRRIVATFSILRDGRIANASLVEPSGVADLDKSAMDALQSASPLPPLPKGAPKSVDIKYLFDWKVKQE